MPKVRSGVFLDILSDSIPTWNHFSGPKMLLYRLHRLGTRGNQELLVVGLVASSPMLYTKVAAMSESASPQDTFNFEMMIAPRSH